MIKGHTDLKGPNVTFWISNSNETELNEPYN